MISRYSDTALMVNLSITIETMFKYLYIIVFILQIAKIQSDSDDDQCITSKVLCFEEDTYLFRFLKILDMFHSVSTF